MGGDATHILYGLPSSAFPNKYAKTENLNYAGSLCKTEKNKLYIFSWGYDEPGSTIPGDASLTIRVANKKDMTYIGYHLCSLWRDAALKFDNRFLKLQREAEDHWKEHLSHISDKPEIIIIGGR